MKIYLIKSKENLGYDTYDSMLIIAGSEGRAIEMSIIEGTYNTWVTNKDELTIEDIGISHTEEERIVITSFNAG